MAVIREQLWKDKPSIKYQCGSRRGSVFQIVDYGNVDNVSTPTSDKQKSRTCERIDSHSQQICSTRELISALGSVWDQVTTGPLSVLVPRSSSRYETHYNSEDRKWSAGSQNHPINLKRVGDSLPVVSRIGFIKVQNKISLIQPSCGNISVLRRFLHSNSIMIPGHLKESTSSDSTNFSVSVSGNDSPTDLIMENDEFRSKDAKFADSSLDQTGDSNSRVDASSATSWSDNERVQAIEVSSSKIPDSYPCVDFPESLNEHESSSNADLEEVRINHLTDFAAKRKSKVQIRSPTLKENPNRALATQEHAFAGAMAGVFVSLSLHPLDTVKTVVQSCRADQRPLLDISRSIISQRGITGLYRGISTNIASSAPISALYTFTYESMKGTLLTFLPIEYQSVAHCMAGGCASIATSFIFTPSERIKQQMQVGSRYQNCWNALMGIIDKGGLPSLYAGWGAVLCRNVPHSIIKFYTYESLKRLLSSAQLDGQTNTIVTLVSGGLAASTAALFTTPFDVVKTRLQTRIPGSKNQCTGVFDTLKDIAKNEGLRGLYRGLTPRLFMYMTQGGLFFASYESFKILFCP